VGVVEVAVPTLVTGPGLVIVRAEEETPSLVETTVKVVFNVSAVRAVLGLLATFDSAMLEGTPALVALATAGADIEGSVGVVKPVVAATVGTVLNIVLVLVGSGNQDDVVFPGGMLLDDGTKSDCALLTEGTMVPILPLDTAGAAKVVRLLLGASQVVVALENGTSMVVKLDTGRSMVETGLKTPVTMGNSEVVAG
jgi:hypothetical protein